MNKKLKEFLPKYRFLFDGDINDLYKVFNEVVEKENVDLLARDFEIFLKWIFSELYGKEIIDKKTFDELDKRLACFNIKPSSIWAHGIGGPQFV